MSATDEPVERLLFLPGAGGDPAFWKPLADRLEHPAERVLLAWPGSVSGSKVRSLDDLYPLVVQYTDRSVALIAQSMGGVLALRAALDFPARVRQLVLTATSGGLDMARFGAEDWRPAWRVQRPTETWWADERSNFEDRLGDILAPTLLLFGENDSISPIGVGQYLANQLRFPNSSSLRAAITRSGEIAPSRLPPMSSGISPARGVRAPGGDLARRCPPPASRIAG
jgi:poly(3-hydroxyoctanoate) depolymerase